MSKTAYVHTFHSQVPETILALDYYPDIIFSFDSHVDAQMGIKEHLDAIPDSYYSIALRTSAHTDIRKVSGDVPMFLSQDEREYLTNCPFFLVIPQIGFETDVVRFRGKDDSTHINGKHQQALDGIVRKSFNAQKKFQKSFLKRMFDINIFESPPNNLGKFIDKIKPLSESIWDIDVDYMFDFQDECYTPLKKATSTQLGNKNRVLKTIRKYNPEVITISEAKNSVINESSSKFYKFIKDLKKLDYNVDYTNVIDKTDKDMFNLLEIYKKYVHDVQEPIQIKYSYKPTEEFINELIEATKKYFDQFE